MKEKTITNQIQKHLKSCPECFAFKEHGGMYSTLVYQISFVATKESL